MTLDIRSFGEQDYPDINGEGDFYVIVKASSTAGFRTVLDTGDRVIEDDGHLLFIGPLIGYWSTGWFVDDSTLVKIDIEVWDEDDGPDDPIDINPYAGSTTLHLFVDPKTGRLDSASELKHDDPAPTTHHHAIGEPLGFTNAGKLISDGEVIGEMYFTITSDYHWPWSGDIVGNDLVIDNGDGDPDDNAWSIKRDGDSLVITDTNVETGAPAFASIPSAVLSADNHTVTIPVSVLGPGGKIIFKGEGGNDSLQVDSSTDLGFDVDFQGGAGTSNSLSMIGGTATSVTHTATNAHDGSISIVNGSTRVISYSGMAAVTDPLIALARTFNYSGGSDAITLQAAGPSLRIASTLGVAVTFANPTDSLDINSGSGDDSIVIASVDPTFAAQFVINGGADTDSVQLNGDLSLAPGKSLTVTAETIYVGASANLVMSGVGAITLTSTSLFLLSGASLETQGPTISITADSMAIDSLATINAGIGSVKLKPGTAGRNVYVGLDFNAGLSLTDAELDRITAGTIFLGDATTGPVAMFGFIQHAGDSNFQIVTGANIQFNGSNWTTNNGNLTFTANQAGQMFGATNGIALVNATLTTAGTGNITLTGRGGIAPDSNSVQGVVSFSSVVQSTAVGLAAGQGLITIDGTSGTGLDFCYGVLMVNGTAVKSAAGNIQITGVSQATRYSNYGVNITAAAKVAATGTAGVTISGTGAAGTTSNEGVIIFSPNTSVTAVDGDISIIGQGGSSIVGGVNNGITLYLAAYVQSFGSGKITFNGTAGGGNSTGSGVLMTTSQARVESAGGGITLIGHGAGNNSTNSNRGVYILDTTQILASGNATITINGTGGNGVSNDFGVQIVGFGTQVSSVNGDIYITGRGGSTSIPAIGVELGATFIGSTGTGNIAITGSNGAIAENVRGIQIDGGCTLSANSRDINLNAPGSGALISIQAAASVKSISHAVYINADNVDIGQYAFPAVNAATVTIKPTTAGRTMSLGAQTAGSLSLTEAELDSIAAGTIILGDTQTSTVTVKAAMQHYGDSNFQVVTGRNIAFNSGTGWSTTNGSLSFFANQAGTASGNFHGIDFYNAVLSSSGSGSITLTGRGGTVDGYNIGINLNASSIQSTGTGQITLNGTGGNGTWENQGVRLDGVGTSVTSTAGNINITGQGGFGTAHWNIGVWMLRGAVVTASGNAKITIDGKGGGGNVDNNGVLFNGFGTGGATKVTSQNGDILIKGRGATVATDAWNRGIGVFEGTVIRSTGTAKITLDGTGGGGPHSARGVEIAHTGTFVTSVSGDILIKGQGGDNNSAYGVWMHTGSVVESTGSAKVTLDGTGGAAHDGNGLIVQSSGTRVSSVNGDITIKGQGGNAGSTGAYTRGVGIFDAVTIQSTGLAKITIKGTGGTGNDSSRGIEIGDNNTRITSAYGAIDITGQGGPDAYGFGIWMRSGAVVDSTVSATITMKGTGGSGGAGGESDGVMVNGFGNFGSTRVSSLNGDIVVVGHGGSSTTTAGDRGVAIFEGAAVQSTGSAKITIDGTAGSGRDSERAVEIGDSNSKVSSSRGDISITGHAGAGFATTGTYNIGVWIRDNAVVESTATDGIAAKIMIDGTGVPALVPTSESG